MKHNVKIKNGLCGPVVVRWFIESGEVKMKNGEYELNPVDIVLVIVAEEASGGTNCERLEPDEEMTLTLGEEDEDCG